MKEIELHQKLSRQLLRLALLLWLFRETLKPTETTDKTAASDKLYDFSRIRCPLCTWQPNASSRWFCGDCDYPEYFFEGCGTAWNTFTTRGLCPGCRHQWRWTITWSRGNFFNPLASGPVGVDGRALHDGGLYQRSQKRDMDIADKMLYGRVVTGN